MKSYRFDSKSPATGDPISGHLTFTTGNPKTGPGWQLAILSSEVHPLDAIKSGEDRSVCGSCPLRRDPVTGVRKCYVTPMALGQMYKKGPSRVANPDPKKVQISGYLRLGMYGDPAMLPFLLVAELAKKARKVTGYTHQWQEPWYDRRFDSILMRSVESIQQAQECWKAGARTFRIDLEGIGPQKGEIRCPNEERPEITCAQCGLCNGSGDKKSPKSIMIAPHGTAFRKKKIQDLRVIG